MGENEFEKLIYSWLEALKAGQLAVVRTESTNVHARRELVDWYGTLLADLPGAAFRWAERDGDWEAIVDKWRAAGERREGKAAGGESGALVVRFEQGKPIESWVLGGVPKSEPEGEGKARSAGRGR